jgi:hypothetical protein
MDPTHFSRWKKSTANAPDPRQPKNKRVYLAISKALNLPLTEVLSYILFPLPESTRSKLFVQSLEQDVLQNTEVGKKLYLIGLNSAGNEEALDLVLDIMSSYITRIKGGKWKSAE